MEKTKINVIIMLLLLFMGFFLLFEGFSDFFFVQKLYHPLAKETSMGRVKGTVLERALLELEKGVAECKHLWSFSKRLFVKHIISFY